MNYNTQDWELNLKDMCLYVLYQWKRILPVGIVLAMLLGGFQGISFLKNRASAGADTPADEAYLEQLEKYEQERAIMEARVSSLENTVSSQTTYLEESPMMLLDPHNSYTATATLYASTDYKILPEMTYQTPDHTNTILSLYEASLLDDATLTEIAAEYGIKVSYLKELVEVEVQMEANLLTVSATYFDEEGAQAILNSLLDALYAVEPQISLVFGDHELSTMLQTVGVRTDDYIETLQKTESDRLLDLSKELLAKQAELAAMTPPAFSAIAGTGLKDVIVWTVLGLIAGAAMCAVFYCCLFIFGNGVFSSTELHSRLGIRILGSLVPEKKRIDFITRWLRNLEGRSTIDTDNSIALIGVNIHNACSDAKKILITGSVEKDTIREISEKLASLLSGVSFVACGSVLADADALRTLPDCDGVVLVESCKTSNYSTIIKELTCIEDFNRCVGCIVIE